MKQTRQATTIDKGRIVEKIIALLHEHPGISVKVWKWPILRLKVLLLGAICNKGGQSYGRVCEL